MKQFFVEHELILEDESKLKHLEHVEDHVFNAGHAGYEHAVSNIQHVHHALKTGSPKEGHHVTTKMDGSPSVVFGHHPENGKFFVGSKSVFNKNPKINYSESDIDANHGHSPGLAEKLKAALHHLPKVTPHGVYQGDIMHTKGDVKAHDDHYHFTPNTITYSAHKDSDEAKKIHKSKIGIATHTKYHGSSLDNMHAGFHVDHENFKDHDDVHKVSVAHDFSKSKYSTLQQRQVETHLKKAEDLHKKLTGKYDDLKPHTEHIKTYINHTVRTGEEPSVDGYKAHSSNRLMKEVEKVKTPKFKEAKKKTHDDHLNHIVHNEDTINNALKLHGHLQKAKDHIVDALASHHEYKHSVNGEETKPEGYVSVLHGRPTKFVKRSEFSKLNFANNDKRKGS